MSTRTVTPAIAAAVAVLTPQPRPMLQRTCDCGQHTGGGQCEDCKKKKMMPLQRHANGSAAPAVAPPIVHDVLRSSGQPLEKDAQSYFASKFEHDFSHVRVHTDEQAAESALAVRALAYTVGNHVVFGAGRYSPANSGGRRLLAHELTHVVQQRHNSVPSPQYSLEIGPSHDRYEREAEQLSERMTSGMEASQEADAHLSPTRLSPNRVAPCVQRAEAAESPATAAGTTGAASAPSPAAASLLVEDDALDLKPGQMKKGEFLDKLQTSVCATADEVLSSVGRSAQGCPYIERWIGHLRTKGSQFLERGIRKYAPDSAGVAKAEDYIPFVAARVRRGVARWARTGEITEVPDELKGQLLGANILAGVDRVLSGIGGAIGGAVSAIAGGVKKAASAIGGVFAKGRDGGVRDAGDPQEIQAQLRSGHPLDGGVKSRMEAAFGGDFSAVRIHTDSSAAELSTRLNARAFTIGRDVAFGAGEYRPGTLIGDALIAHELAHAMQQGNENSAITPLTQGGTEHNALEEDADVSAVGAVTSMWFGREGHITELAHDALPRLKSGLRLQRCGGPERKLDISAWTAKQQNDFITKNFDQKDRSFASNILRDMLESSEVKFVDEESLKADIFKRLKSSELMQKTQNLYGVAFEYPEHGTHCIPNNTEKKKYPRVNKAAEAYWGPVQYDSEGIYYFELTEKGKNDAYRALTLLFTPQNKSGDKKKDICNMTLIHCDFLASVVHFRAFAEEIGVEEFNRRVKNGDVDMRLAWNGFQELEDVGWFHSKKGVSLREVRPANPKELVIGDHVIFFNHRAYDLINTKKPTHEWRLENAFLIYRAGKEDMFEGHGSGINSNHSMLTILAGKYNDVVEEARKNIEKTKSADPKIAAAGTQEMTTNYPHIKPKNGEWNITGHSWGKDFDEPLRPLDKKSPEKETDLPGLRDPENPSRMGCVKRPAEAPGESC